MAKLHQEWTVLPHGPLERLAENLWRVEARLPDMPLKRVMVVARMADGRLLIHNGIALEEPQMQQLEQLGEPAVMVVPNGWHRLDAPAFKGRYPDLRVLCPHGSRKRVEQAVAVDGILDDLEAGDDHTVQLFHLDGLKQREGALQVRSEDGLTLVFNDLIFNLPHGKGIPGLVFRLMGSTGGPRISRIFRLMAVSDGRALRAHMERLAEIEELRRVIVSHGKMIDDDPAAVLRSVASTLPG